MSLEYLNAYHCHCSIPLKCGRRITLKSITQEMTYGGLLEGTPTSSTNDAMLRGTADRVRNIPAMGGHVPFLIPPARRDFFREPGDMARTQRKTWVPEWMPVITCIGSFESARPVRNQQMHASCLAIIWLQDDYAMPISDAALESIKSINWASYAFDFEY